MSYVKGQGEDRGWIPGGGEPVGVEKQYSVCKEVLVGGDGAGERPQL